MFDWWESDKDGRVRHENERNCTFWDNKTKIKDTENVNFGEGESALDYDVGGKEGNSNAETDTRFKSTTA